MRTQRLHPTNTFLWLITAFLVGISWQATARNYYEVQGFRVLSGMSTAAYGNSITQSPQATCEALDASNDELTQYSLSQVNPGVWDCHQYSYHSNGDLLADSINYFGGLCQVNPADAGTGNWTYPYRDASVGACYCSGAHYFDPKVQWCSARPSCPGGRSSLKNGQWVCEDTEKQLGNASCSNPTSHASVGNPINPATGNKFQTENDYTGQGAFALQVSRTYNSVNGQWRFFPAIESIWPATAYSSAKVIHSDGKALSFSPGANGNWTTDADIRSHLTSITDTDGELLHWEYQRPDNSVMTFNAEGQITAITNRYGISHQYTYTDTTITVTHSHGASLVYSLDTAGKVTGVQLPDGESVSYQYDTNDNLTQMTYAAQPPRLYHYEDTNFPNALTGLTDETGNRFATWAYDSDGRAISSEHGNAQEKVTIDYTHIDDATDPRVTITNPLGKQTTYHYETLHGSRKLVSVEGHQSQNCAAANQAYTYDTNGFMASKTDWNGTVTTYVHNTKGQETSRVEASGTPQARTITTEWHTDFNLPMVITEPKRITRFTYDTQGRLLNRTIEPRTP